MRSVGGAVGVETGSRGYVIASVAAPDGVCR